MSTTCPMCGSDDRTVRRTLISDCSNSWHEEVMHHGARLRAQTGLRWCVVSATLERGELRIHGILICKNREEAERRVIAGGIHPAQPSQFVAEIWIEDHSQ